ncbi:hypothetical protein LXL04_016878 [Taraxacum kok-saghyz]
MLSMYRFLSDLQPELTDKWKVHVMVTRKWRTFNPRSGKILSDDLILTDERNQSIHATIPESLMECFYNKLTEGVVYQIHQFEVKVYRTQYRPLNRDMFIQLLRRTSIRASHIPATAFQRYCFDFIAYGALQSRVYEHTYLSDVIGYLREWSFVKQTGDTSRSNVRQIILSDESVTERVRFKLKEDIVEETVQVTTIPYLYLKLQEGVEEGTRFCICGTIVDVDVREWKYVRCSDCRKKVVLCEGRFYCGSCKKNTINPREAYMLAVKVYEKNEFMTCVLFDVAATPLLGFTVDQLVNMSLSEMDNIVNNTDNVENINNVITVPSAVSSPFASSSVVRAEQEIVDTINVDGTVGNIKSVKSETLMFEGVAEVTDEEDNEVNAEKMKKVPSQSSMVEQCADNMEDLVCDKDKAEVDKGEHNCGKSGTKVTKMEVYQDNGPSLKYDGSKTPMVEDVADNIEDHECYEDIIGGSNVEEDVSKNPVADVNEMQDTKDLESDEACLRQLRHNPLPNNILEERILLNQKVKQGYQLVYAIMKLRVLVEEQLEMKLKGIKEK